MIVKERQVEQRTDGRSTLARSDGLAPHRYGAGDVTPEKSTSAKVNEKRCSCGWTHTLGDLLSTVIGATAIKAVLVQLVFKCGAQIRRPPAVVTCVSDEILSGLSSVHPFNLAI